MAAPARRSTARIALHWATALSLWAVIALGRDTPDWAAWAFGLSAGAFALAGLSGLMSRPGPKLQGTLRVLHPWSHRAIYALAAWAGLAVLAPVLGFALPGPTGFTLALLLLSVTSLHSLFHLWRHTVLRDNAFHLILPKALHPLL